jgi:hypothetical protein
MRRGCLAVVRMLLILSASSILLAIGVPLALRWWTDHRYRRLIYTPEAVPPRQWAPERCAG